MNREPSNGEVRGADQRVAATCWSCQAPLARGASFCSRCGEAQAVDDWDECQIGFRRERLQGEFTARYRGEAPWSIAARSGRFRWVGRGGEPPRTSAAEACLAEFCRVLERDGWERRAAAGADPWYQLSFCRYTGPAEARPEHPPVLEPEPLLEPEPEFLLAPEFLLEPEPELLFAPELFLEPEPVVEVEAAPEAEVEVEAETEPVPVLSLVPPAPPVEPVEVAAEEEPAAVAQPDPEPVPGQTEPVEPDQEAAAKAWHLKPVETPVNVETLVPGSELCSRIGAYVARTG